MIETQYPTGRHELPPGEQTSPAHGLPVVPGTGGKRRAPGWVDTTTFPSPFPRSDDPDATMAFNVAAFLADETGEIAETDVPVDYDENDTDELPVVKPRPRLVALLLTIRWWLTDRYYAVADFLAYVVRYDELVDFLANTVRLSARWELDHPRTVARLIIVTLSALVLAATAVLWVLA